MLLSTRILVSSLVACTIPLLTISKVLTQTPATSPNLPSTGLKTTDRMLNQVCNFLKNRKYFTVEMDITYDNVLDSGAKVQYSAHQRVWVNKPNQLRSDYRGDERNTNFYYDGKSFTLHTTDLNLYATKTAPPTIDEAVKNVDLNYGFTIPMSNLFVSEPCAAITSDIQDSVFVGSNMVNRVPGYHILFTGEERDWQIWVSKGQQPLPMKVVIVYKNLPGAPQYTAVLSRWNFISEIPEDTFTFEPPVGAIGIEFLPDETVGDAAEK